MIPVLVVTQLSESIQMEILSGNAVGSRNTHQDPGKTSFTNGVVIQDFGALRREFDGESQDLAIWTILKALRPRFYYPPCFQELPDLGI